MTVEEINNNIKLGIFSKDILDDICKYDSINNNYIIKDIESSKLINWINTNNIKEENILKYDDSTLFSDKYKIIRFYCGIFVYLKGKRILKIT